MLCSAVDSWLGKFIAYQLCQLGCGIHFSLLPLRRSLSIFTHFHYSMQPLLLLLLGSYSKIRNNRTECRQPYSRSPSTLPDIYQFDIYDGKFNFLEIINCFFRALCFWLYSALSITVWIHLSLYFNFRFHIHLLFSILSVLSTLYVRETKVNDGKAIHTEDEIRKRLDEHTEDLHESRDKPKASEVESKKLQERMTSGK